MKRDNWKWYVSAMVTPIVAFICPWLLTFNSTMALCAAIGYLVYVIWVAWITRPEQFDRDTLYRLLSAFLRVLEIPPDDDVRCTIWVRENRESLKQIVNYVPKNTTGPFKTLHTSKGIVGLACRTGEAQSLMLSKELKETEYKDILITNWGFTEDEAARVNKERRAFIAIPVVKSDGKVSAVIYCDTKDPDIFAKLDISKLLDKAKDAAILLEPLL